jgi:hypothetical protein
MTDREKIDRLLKENAEYRANHVCVGNTSVEKGYIDKHCQETFIDPIRDIDPEFYESIKMQE